MSGDIQPYLDLIPSANASKPNFLSVLSTFLQPFADITDIINSIPEKFDLDMAVGQQLDFTGQWIGQSRFIEVPLVGVYFSFDINGVGFDQGAWIGPDVPTTELDALPDEFYRTVLKAKVAANSWDGTIPSSNRIWDELFASQGLKVITQDNGNMTMTVGIIIPPLYPLDAITRSLFMNHYFELRPAGVLTTGFYEASGVPFFGFDSDTESVGGFDHGTWATTITARLGIDFVLGSSILGY